MQDKFLEHSYQVVDYWIESAELCNVINLRGYFKRTYALTGKDWIKRINPEDRAALCRYVFACSDYGRLGGKARATKAKRYPKGHPKAGQFAPD